MADTRIEWAQKVWNPVTGCTKISSGCQNCYAERMAKRLRGRCGYPADEPFRVTLHPKRLEEPLRWRKPRMIFVCSMGDLFHEGVPDDFINKVFTVMTSPMSDANHHTYLMLTKRPDRILKGHAERFKDWPNIWLGVTVENQEMADKRIPILLQIPAAVRFVSVEPMLGPINLRKWLFYQMRCTKCKDTGWVTGLERPCLWCNPGGEFRSSVSPAEKFKPKLDWIICGGETGPKARPMHPDWVRSLRDQCRASRVPFFFKSWGEWYPDNKGIYESAHRVFFGNTTVHRIGKKSAGRLLDGREWNEMPEVG